MGNKNKKAKTNSKDKVSYFAKLFLSLFISIPDDSYENYKVQKNKTGYVN